jgi:hypothetical protein
MIHFRNSNPKKQNKKISGLPSCLNCGYQSKFLLRCAGCRRARYCGVTCQEDGWGKHQELCTKKMEKRKGGAGNAIMIEKDNLDNEVD